MHESSIFCPVIPLLPQPDAGGDRHPAARDAEEPQAAAPGAVTSILARIEAGDSAAPRELFDVLYAELHRRARAFMHGQPAPHTLQPTALVHEAYVRLLEGREARWKDRRHFLLAASQAMRHVLVDHARRRSLRRREGDAAGDALAEVLDGYESSAFDLEALDRALGRLAEMDPEMARAVDLRFFGGLDVGATCAVLGLSARTFQRRWATARAWLYRQVR